MKRIRVKQLVTCEGDEETVMNFIFDEGTAIYPEGFVRTIETTSTDELLPYDLNKKP